MFYFYLKNKPIWYHLGQNFQNFLLVVGVGEEGSGASELHPASAAPASTILENCCFGAFSDMECIFQVKICLTGLFVAENWILFQENSEENIGLNQKNAINISKYPYFSIS